MSRREARNKAFYLLFQLDFAQEDERDTVKRIFWEENEIPSEEDRNFITKEVGGVLENLAEIDTEIDKYAKGWSTNRMSKVDLAILRLAVYEIKYSEETPNSVAVNEAVELAKKYSSDEAPGFINGILGKIA